MISWPGFNLNDLSRGIPIEEWEAMQNDPDIPLYNRATQGLYTPGSVFKLMTSAALLETNSMTINDQFPASEDIVQEDKWFPSEAFLNNLPERASTDSWYDQSQDHFLVRTHSDSRPAPMNMTNSIISSDNLYFSYAAMRMGWTKFQAFMESIGWNNAITLEATGHEAAHLLESRQRRHQLAEPRRRRRNASGSRTRMAQVERSAGRPPCARQTDALRPGRQPAAAA